MTEARTSGDELIRRGALRVGPLARRVAFVRDLAEKLTGAGSVEEVGEVVRAGMRRGFGVCAVILNLVSDDGAHLTTLVADGAAGRTQDLLAAPIPLDDSTPAMRALSLGTPILWPSLAARDREYPGLHAFPSKAKSWAILPLIVRGTPIGTLSVGWPQQRRFGRVESAILEIIAHQCAVAVDRARIERVRRAERATLELLSEGTRIMVSALEPARVLEALVHLAVPRLAPWCAVYVAEGGTLRRVAIEIEGAGRLAASLRGASDVAVDAEVPIAVAYRTGVSSVVYPIEPEVVRAVYPADQAEFILERGGSWTGMVVPVRTFGTVVGVVTLVSPEWGASPPDDVRFAAEGLAGRAGVALGNARRYQDERELAAQLMEAFLPARLPSIPGYDVAARYLPAGGRVAGDWYDVIQVAKDRYLVGIGDAGGHGIHAASLMGQLRNSARGLAVTGHGPADLVEALHLLTAEDSPDSFATALYGELDVTGHVVRWAGAGHIPVLEYGEGSARFVEQPGGRALGGPSATVDEWQGAMQPGHGVVLVTDGVVERRASDIEAGMRSLREVVEDGTALRADELGERIAERLCRAPEDDCCVVVIRRH